MSKRIFRSICLVALVVFLASLALIMGLLYDYFSRVQLQQLHTETMLTARAVSNEGITYFDELEVRDCRITWIAADGTVLYDTASDTGGMENHLAREEIQEALETGTGESSRYSDTLMEQSMYTARRLPDGTVLRLSVDYDSVLTLLLGVARPICMVIAIAIVLAMLLASRLSKWVVAPLNALDLDAPLSQDNYSELAPLFHRIRSQQGQLRAQAQELKRRQRQFDTVTASMAEGLVLLDNKAKILSINRAAESLLGAKNGSVGKNFLNIHHSSEICGLLYTALNGEKAEKVLRLGGSDYQVDATPVHADGQVSGVVVLLFDVTEKQKAQLLRREFTANVSHELKTPLHAISGYAELMKSGLVPPEDAPLFSEKIYSEAQRLIRLVEDILKLSRLDHENHQMERTSTDLYALAKETAEDLRSAAELADVQLTLEGSRAMIDCIPQLARGILFNLTDNAIKYNRPGGRVILRIGQNESTVMLTVADTGIGIPEDQQERVFERFYRVDKSHSKAVGGTGLGLSIVKHAAAILGAKIALNSMPGEGTTITVIFRK